ncbi:diguanylate cyclase domain-containing protein [Methylobacterium haplocladii]|nr:diguanylate cyclase [Methylobacterium haplocladii]GJD84227.1 hypothetical protein HPGCJGGD_2102 [Methylobacterium haplocladii]
MSVGSPDPLASLLERIRRSFCVRAAMVRFSDDEGRPAEFHAGAPIPWSDNPAACRLQALAAAGTVVVPDIDLEDDAAGRAADRPRIRFFAGIPLLSETGCPFGVLSLFHAQPRWLSPVHVRALEDLAAELAPVAARRRDDVIIARLRHRLDVQAATMRAQAEELVQGRGTFERAAAGARVGIWECALHDESLTWTDQVYDLFEIPRGTRLARRTTLDCYTPGSRAVLERTRSAAIAGRRDFRLDAEIITLKGRRRWIRLTAATECRDGVPVRLFGMKQDITEQTLLLERTRYLADFDVMTGLANRASFEARLAYLGTDPRDRAPIGALLLIDLDGFKRINDGFGHALGDACLQEAARRLRAVCAGAELVARIGGDEFAVLIGCSLREGVAEALAEAIVASLSQPMQSGAHAFRIGASVGIAPVGRPCTPSDLFIRADTALYAAKAAGRGTFRTFDLGIAGGDLGHMPQPGLIDGERRSLRRPALN